MGIKLNASQRNILVVAGIAFYFGTTTVSSLIALYKLPNLDKEYFAPSFLNLRQYISVKRMYIFCFASAFSWSILCGTIWLLYLLKRFEKRIRGAFFPPWVIISMVFLCFNIYFVLKTWGDTRTIASTVEMALQDSIEEYGEDKHTKAFIDILQRRNRCCGSNNAMDWYSVIWKSQMELVKYANANYKWYHGKPGLIQEAPKSCCDRMRGIICIINFKQRQELNIEDTYFESGCYARLVSSFTSKLVWELPLFGIVLLVHLMAFFFCRLVQTSATDAAKRGDPNGKGEAIIFSSSYRTSDLETMLTHRVLLSKLAISEEALFALKQQWLKNHARIGRVIKERTFIRSTKRAPLSALQKFLRKNFKFFEILLYEENPNFLLEVTRFLLNLMLGFVIGYAFTAFYLEKRMTVLDKSFSFVIKFSIYVLFTYTFAFSPLFRATCFLILPNMFMSVGRTFILTLLILETMKGPISSLIHNFNELTRMVTCSLQAAQNATAQVEKIRNNPFRDMVFKVFVRFYKVHKKIKRFKMRVKKLLKIGKSSDNEAKRTRYYLKHCTDKKDSAIDPVKMEQIIEKQDESENVVVKTMKRRLNATYEYIKEKARNVRNRAFYIGATKVVAGIRKRFLTNCGVLMHVQLGKCRLMLTELSRRCYKDTDKITPFNVIFQPFCLLIKKLKSVCPDETIVPKVDKKCDSELKSTKTDAQLGLEFSEVESVLNSLDQHFSTAVKWSFKQITFDIFKTPERAIENAANAAFGFQQRIKIFLSSLQILSSLLAVIACMVLVKSMKYIRKYCKDNAFDNYYISNYFEEIDQRRTKQHRQTVLPLTKSELNEYVYKQKLPIRVEAEKMIPKIFQTIALSIGIVIIITIDSTFYTTVLKVREYASIVKGTQQNQTETNTTVLFEGGGLAAGILNAYANQMQFVTKMEHVRQNICLPMPKKTGAYALQRVGFFLFFFLMTICFQSYAVRSQHHIGAFFFPRTERRRTVYVYNDVLLKRRKTANTMKTNLIRKLRRNDFHRDNDTLLSVREMMPALAKVIKAIGGHYICLVCDESENPGFFVCEKDQVAYCQRCYEELDRRCLSCLIRGESGYAAIAGFGLGQESEDAAAAAVSRLVRELAQEQHREKQEKLRK